MGEAPDGHADLITRQARRFALEHLDPHATDRTGGISPELLERAAEAGLFALSIPEHHGGLSLSLGEVCAVVEELARVDRSFATTVGLHAGLGTRGLVELGAPHLKEAWLPRLAAGETVAAFAATEPSAGSDLSNVRTLARPDGDMLQISGEKCFVTNGGFAGVFTVLARTPSYGGRHVTSLLLVPRDTAGVAVGPEEHKLGIRGSSTVSVRFDEVRVPASHVLGAPGTGAESIGRVLTWGRTLMSAGCIGTARTALDQTLAHVTRRRQSGRPIGHFAASRAHVTHMACRLKAMEALVRHVGDLEARGLPAMAAAAAAKVFTSEGAFDVVDRALQLHGGMGFLEDTGIAILLRDCRVTRIFEGANDVLLVRLGTMIAAGEMEPCAAPRTGAPDPTSHRAWHDARSALERTVSAERATQGVRLARDQVTLSELARAHTALLAAAALTHGGGPFEDRITAESFRRLVRSAERALSSIDHGATREARTISDALYARSGLAPVRHSQEVSP